MQNKHPIINCDYSWLVGWLVHANQFLRNFHSGTGHISHMHTLDENTMDTVRSTVTEHEAQEGILDTSCWRSGTSAAPSIYIYYKYRNEEMNNKKYICFGKKNEFLIFDGQLWPLRSFQVANDVTIVINVCQAALL